MALPALNTLPSQRRKNRLFIQNRTEGSFSGVEKYRVIFHGGNSGQPSCG